VANAVKGGPADKAGLKAKDLNVLPLDKARELLISIADRLDPSSPEAQTVIIWNATHLTDAEKRTARVVCDFTDRGGQVIVLAAKELGVEAPPVVLDDQLDRCRELTEANTARARVCVPSHVGQAFLRNPHYHGPSDRPETLDFAAMTQVVRSLLRYLRSVHE
jgi:hypothetical protein